MDIEEMSLEKLDDLTEDQLRKGIRNLEKQIDDHVSKISNPDLYYSSWSTYIKEMQDGIISHWVKEIRAFYIDIENRNEEIRRR